MKNTLYLSRITQKGDGTGVAQGQLLLLLFMLSACGGGNTASPPSIGVTLTPENVSLDINQSIQFTATVHNSTNHAVVWSLSGGASCGTISDTGLYTAPSIAPSPAIVTIIAMAKADVSKTASATVTITDPAVDPGVVWAWMSGNDINYQAGVYGTKGVADPANVPCSRESAVTWLGSDGTLWLFGGNGHEPAGQEGEFNDLWRYEPDASLWTWVSGADIGNRQGIYGIKGTADPTNMPGARVAAASWTDADGKLWLFGGSGYDSAGVGPWLNDLWKFDPATLEWTWVTGSDVGMQPGTYGTQLVPDASNTPGSRVWSVARTDPNGKFWLFGGNGFGIGLLNDLWKFDPVTQQWTWISGSNSDVQAAVYGTKCRADAANVPGSRTEATAWFDSAGKFWLFGGWGFDANLNQSLLNDLWKYDPIIHEWTWVSGSSALGQMPVYGTKGIPEPSNIPGSRSGAVSWSDGQGRFWLFGGLAIDAAGNGGPMNDLWRWTR